MMDSDLQKLLVAWTSGVIDEVAIAPVLDRLRREAAFRQAFVSEIAMLGQLKAVQSSEPRWLQLEDVLGVALNNAMSVQNIEDSVMNSITRNSDAPSQTSIANTLPTVRWLSKQLFWPLSMSAVLGFILLWSGSNRDSSEPASASIASKSDPTNTYSAMTDAAAEDSSDASNKKNGGGVAILSQSIGVEWMGHQHPVVGDTLQLGDLQIKSGTIQIEFFAGVRLLLRGPADFELRAPDEMQLRQGAASCFVSELGRGFRILTDGMEVVDLGTAFSIDVQNGKQSEVHVLEGEVEIKSGTRASMKLQKNQAIRMAPTGPVDALFTPSRFPQPADLQIEQRNQDRQRFEAWKRFSDRLSTDPAVMMHYTFEDSGYSPSELSNRSLDASHASDGAIIGCTWADGRWPLKRALQYRNPGDRVLFQVHGQHEQLTFMVWVRIDALTQPQTSLLMTEEPARRRNLNPTVSYSIAEALDRRKASQVKSVRWELFQPVPRVSFSVATTQGESDWKWESCHSKSDFPSQSNWGKWACVAVTCDTVNGRVRHYHNGERISDLSLPHTNPLLLDFMTLGNFSVSDAELKTSGGLAQRRFYGAVDEVLIANRVLNDDELTDIWTNGRP